jgi:hypothetical protein
MPQGFDVVKEAQLHRAPRLLNPEVSRSLADWWLPTGLAHARTPNFDIAASCSVDGQTGIVLVEAKAHDQELIKESAGRRIGPEERLDRRASHETIARAIDEANTGLGAATAYSWSLSCDSHYQMSNRFAWAWKLADLGVPVVLVYLAFLGADEMKDRGDPIVSPAEWVALVMQHSAPLFPAGVWDRKWAVNGVPFIPLIASVNQPLHPTVCG